MVMVYEDDPYHELHQLTAAIEGWLTNREIELLYHLARRCPGRGVIVEIGSWKGKSTVCLAKGSQHGNRAVVYAIDPHTSGSLAEFSRTIARTGTDDLVVPLVKTSEKAVQNFDLPVELLFIDGDHSYQAVKQDCERWSEKLVEGGTIAFHDTAIWSQWDDPRRFVAEHVYRSTLFRRIRRVDSITLAEKTRHNTWQDRLANRGNLLLKHAYEAGYRLHARLPAPVRTLVRRLAHRLSATSPQ